MDQPPVRHAQAALPVARLRRGVTAGRQGRNCLQRRSGGSTPAYNRQQGGEMTYSGLLEALRLFDSHPGPRWPTAASWRSCCARKWRDETDGVQTEHVGAHRRLPCHQDAEAIRLRQGRQAQPDLPFCSRPSPALLFNQSHSG